MKQKQKKKRGATKKRRNARAFTSSLKIFQRRPFDDKILGADHKDFEEDGVVRDKSLCHARWLAIAHCSFVEHDRHLLYKIKREDNAVLLNDNLKKLDSCEGRT